MLVTIDLRSGLPLFEQIAGSVRRGILDGKIRHGDRLPTAVDLADLLDVNRNTVLRAYQLLQEEGLVELRRRRGATVTAKADTISGLGQLMKTLVAEAKGAGIGQDTLASLVRESYA